MVMKNRKYGPSRALLDLAEGGLDADELESMEAFFRAEGLENPQRWVPERAKKISRQRHGEPAPPSALRRLIATLAFDSRAHPRPAGVRTVETRVRRLLFQAEGVEVDLEVQPSMHGLRLAGQVTIGGSEVTTGSLRLSSSRGEHNARLDDAGEFRVDTLKPGSYRMEFRLDDRVIEIPSFPV